MAYYDFTILGSLRTHRIVKSCIFFIHSHWQQTITQYVVGSSSSSLLPLLARVAFTGAATWWPSSLRIKIGLQCPLLPNLWHHDHIRSDPVGLSRIFRHFGVFVDRSTLFVLELLNLYTQLDFRDFVLCTKNV